MIDNIRFELSFKDLSQLENKLNFCESNNIKNLNIPCKGLIKKKFFYSTYNYIKKNYKRLNVVFHYSLYHQYAKNRDNSYQELLGFIKKCNFHNNYEILLVSGSNKKKNFDVLNVLNALKNEKDLKSKLGIAYNPYLKKYYDYSLERERYERKVSSGLVNSIWLQFGTDIKLLEGEIDYIKNYNYEKIKLFGSLLIPSKQFIARFKYRPWKGVHIDTQYLNFLEDFYEFTKDLIGFYLDNDITPVIETDFCSPDKLDLIYSLFNS